MGGGGEGARSAPEHARWRQELEALAALHSPYLSLGTDTPAGETLAARLAQGPLEAPLDSAIEIATALEGPHRLGILHRHLTLDNVWLLPSGHVQLLRFGLGEAEGYDPREDQPGFGAVLEALAGGGEAAGMRRIAQRCKAGNPDRRYQSTSELRQALERLRPKPPAPTRSEATQRIIAFGVIALAILGMLVWKLRSTPSGGPLPVPVLAFQQATFTADVTQAALSPDGRWLAAVRSDPEGDSLYLLPTAGGPQRLLVKPGVGCCRAPAISPDDHWVDFLAQGRLWSVPVAGDGMRAIAQAARSGAGFAPDGRQIAYINERDQLAIAEADGSQARVLSGAAYGPVTPAWSPDGRRIAAVSGKSVVIVAGATGEPLRLASGTFARISGLVWLPSGRGLIVTAALTPHASEQVWQVSWPEGKRSRLSDDRWGYGAVTASQDGTLALLHEAPQASVWVQARAGAAFEELPGGGMNLDGMAGLAWTPKGGLISTRDYNHDHQFWVEPSGADPARPVALKGPEGALLEPVVTASGELVFQVEEQGSVRVWQSALDGSNASPLTAPDAAWAGVGLVNGGREVEYAAGDHLWAVPVGGGAPRSLGDHPLASPVNVASPDGSRVLVFDPKPEILHLGALGRASAEPVPLDPETMLPPYGWTPDGRALTYVRHERAADNIWELPLGGGAPRALTEFSGGQIFAYTFSRDGRLAVSRGSTNTNVVLATGVGDKR